MDDFTQIIENLRKKKRAMGWTYQEIARRSGYSKGAVARLFLGENVTLRTFADVCQAIGIEVRVV